MYNNSPFPSRKRIHKFATALPREMHEVIMVPDVGNFPIDLSGDEEFLVGFHPQDIDLTRDTVLSAILESINNSNDPLAFPFAEYGQVVVTQDRRHIRFESHEGMGDPNGDHIDSYYFHNPDILLLMLQQLRRNRVHLYSV